MIPALLQRALQGDAEAIASCGEPGHCAVIDWRDGFPEIVTTISAFLPQAFLTVEDQGDSSYRLSARSQPPRSVLIPARSRQEDLLAQIDSVTRPDFELRQFKPVDGDGYALLVAPSAIWSEMESAYPEATERLFLTADRLAAFRRKGFFARLFSRP